MTHSIGDVPAKGLAAAASGTGLSQAEPKVSALRASIPAASFWPSVPELRLHREWRGETMAMIGSRDGQQFLYTAPFRRTDAGRSESKRRRQSNDCTVRALCVATGSSYDDAYDKLKAAGRKAARGFNFKAWAKANTFHGYGFRWIGFPATKGFWRVTPVLFAIMFPQGRYILRTAKHVLACVDGVIHDESRMAEMSCVYGAWEVAQTPSGDPS